MSSDQRRTPETIDGFYERMRSEERAEHLAQVVQDTVRDARLADALVHPVGATPADGAQRG